MTATPAASVRAMRFKSGAWALPFGVTLVAMFALQLSNLGFSPLLPSIQQEFGMSYTQLGLFTGIYGLLALALSVPAGLSAKRFGEKRVLGAGLLGVAAGSVLLGQAWTFEWEPPHPGRHSLRARATDAAGNTQPEVPPWNRLGYGNNAVEVTYVDIV